MGGVIICAVLQYYMGGGGVKCFLFSKWRPEILHEVEYLVFRNYFVFFWKKKSDEIHVFQSDVYF